MVSPVQSLANKEFALYGGMSGANYNCPSYFNGYRANSTVWNTFNPAFWGGTNYGMYNNSPYGYGNYNQTQTTPKTTSTTQNTQSNVQFAANARDIDALAEYYKKHNVMHESFLGALGGGLSFVAFEAPQTIKHPFNSFKAMGETDKVFKGLMESSPELKKLWKTSPDLMQNAYSQMHAINRNAKSKFSVISKWFQKPIDEASRSQLEKIMTDALKTGDKDAILKATETLKASRGMDGYIPTAWNKLKCFFGANPEKARNFTPMERVAKKTADGTIGKAISEHGLSWAKKGLSEGKGWFLFDLVFSAPKIFTAFKEGGTSSGLTQLGQSSVKAAGNAVGWVAGKAVGGLAGAKLGAAIGSVWPGVGTAIGAVVGFIGGSVGMWAMNKLTDKLIPTEEATKLEANKMKKTPEGQVQLIKFAMQKAQEGDKSKDTQLALGAAERIAQQFQATV